MPDASAFEAVSTGAFDLLSAGSTGAEVTQFAGPKTRFPAIVIGDQEGARKIGGKGARADRTVPLGIVVITEGESSLLCGRLLGRVEQLLDAVSIERAGYRLSFTFEQSASMLDPDTGAGFIGLAQFTVFAIPA